MPPWEALYLHNGANDTRWETSVTLKVIEQELTNEDVASQGCRRQAPDYVFPMAVAVALLRWRLSKVS